MLNKLLLSLLLLFIQQAQRLGTLAWYLHPSLTLPVFELTEIKLSISQMRTSRPEEGEELAPGVTGTK